MLETLKENDLSIQGLTSFWKTLKALGKIDHVIKNVKYV